VNGGVASSSSSTPAGSGGLVDGPGGLLSGPAGSGSASQAGSGGAADPATNCVGTSMTAPPAGKAKVDIVWVVDASGSMLDEQMKIGANLTDFAEKISTANIDVHIVMMTASAAIPVICPVTPADPLSGTKLAGDPRYKFIQSNVDSHNALDVAVDNYSMYSSFLRPDAATHFVIVTDDESTYRGLGTPAARAMGFQTDMTMRLGKSFFLHTISSEGPTACHDPNCMPDTSTGICAFVMLGCGAAAPGDTYYAVAHATQGLTASICQSDWHSIFDPLSAAVIASAPLPCNYQIPPPPSGSSLDPSKVNVRYRPASGAAEQLFGKAANATACANAAGWYYDDESAPKQVLLCPTACTSVAAGGTLNIAFGCETVVLQ
jgi:hypothetical protein